MGLVQIAKARLIGVELRSRLVSKVNATTRPPWVYILLILGQALQR